jgi:hypothetical protein
MSKNGKPNLIELFTHIVQRMANYRPDPLQTCELCRDVHMYIWLSSGRWLRVTCDGDKLKYACPGRELNPLIVDDEATLVNYVNLDFPPHPSARTSSSPSAVGLAAG